MNTPKRIKYKGQIYEAVESEERNPIFAEMKSLLSKSISDDYVNDISRKLADYVIDDVQTSADEENWNEDDVRLAIGRALIDFLGIEK